MFNSTIFASVTSNTLLWIVDPLDDVEVGLDALVALADSTARELPIIGFEKGEFAAHSRLSPPAHRLVVLHWFLLPLEKQ